SRSSAVRNCQSSAPRKNASGRTALRDGTTNARSAVHGLSAVHTESAVNATRAVCVPLASTWRKKSWTLRWPPVRPRRRRKKRRVFTRASSPRRGLRASEVDVVRGLPLEEPRHLRRVVGPAALPVALQHADEFPAAAAQLPHDVLALLRRRGVHHHDV